VSRRLAWLWLFVLAACQAVAAHAAPLALHANDTWPRQTASHTRVLEDHQGALTHDEVLARLDQPGSGFVADTRLLHPGFSDSAWWFVLDLANASGVTRGFVVDLQSPRLERVDFHLQQDGRWTATQAGLAAPMDTRGTLSRRPSLRIEMEPDEQVRLLVRVSGRTSMQFLPRVFTPEVLADTELRAALGDVVLVGGLLVVGVYTVLFGLLSRNRRYLLLGGFFCLHALQEASFRGYGKRYLWPESTDWSVVSTPFLFCLGSGLAVLFLHDVIRRARPDVRAVRFLLAYAPLSIVFAAVSLAGQIELASLGYGTSIVAICLLLVVVGATHWKSLPPPGRLIVALLALMLAAAPHRFGEAMGLIGSSSTDSPMDSALTLLALVTVLALLAAWVSRLNRGHTAAREALLAWQAAEHDRLREEVGRQTEALHRALAQAEQTNREQMRIMAYIGHDLRAPIATILGYVRHLRMRATAPETGLRAIERGADYQLSLIDDLLEYSRDTVQPLSVAPKPTDLGALLEDIARYAAALAAQQNNRFVFTHTLRPTGPVMLDARRLQQVLLNLLANAAKFTRDGLITLTVAAESHDDGWMLTFSVDDTGIGIASEDQVRIFGEFEQGQRLGGGVGLGLFIARRIVQSMGGELRLDSAPDAGSRFGFNIDAPRAEAVPSTAELARDELARPVVDLTARNEHASGKASFGSRPDDDALHELAALADDGCLSDIKDWCRHWTLLDPACQPFLEAVEDALGRLDFARIQRLAHVETHLAPSSAKAA
jgi:signal transduction histidine kinase